MVIQRIVFIELFDKVGIYSLLLLVVQVFEGDGEIDSRLDCDVEGSDSIGCEDENAIVVLKYAQ